MSDVMASSLASQLLQGFPVHSATSAGAYRSALFDWHELALFDAGVLGARADDAVVGTLLKHMRRPAGQARADEYRGEQLGWNAHEVIRRRMVEVGVREQFLLLPHGLVDGF